MGMVCGLQTRRWITFLPVALLVYLLLHYLIYQPDFNAAAVRGVVVAAYNDPSPILPGTNYTDESSQSTPGTRTNHHQSTGLRYGSVELGGIGHELDRRPPIRFQGSRYNGERVVSPSIVVSGYSEQYSSSASKEYNYGKLVSEFASLDRTILPGSDLLPSASPMSKVRTSLPRNDVSSDTPMGKFAQNAHNSPTSKSPFPSLNSVSDRYVEDKLVIGIYSTKELFDDVMSDRVRNTEAEKKALTRGFNGQNKLIRVSNALDDSANYDYSSSDDGGGLNYLAPPNLFASEPNLTDVMPLNQLQFIQPYYRTGSRNDQQDIVYPNPEEMLTGNALTQLHQTDFGNGIDMDFPNPPTNTFTPSEAASHSQSELHAEPSNSQQLSDEVKYRALQMIERIIAQSDDGSEVIPLNENSPIHPHSSGSSSTGEATKFVRVTSSSSSVSSSVKSSMATTTTNDSSSPSAAETPVEDKPPTKAAEAASPNGNGTTPQVAPTVGVGLVAVKNEKTVAASTVAATKQVVTAAVKSDTTPKSAVTATLDRSKMPLVTSLNKRARKSALSIDYLKAKTKVGDRYQPGFAVSHEEACPSNGRDLKVLVLITTAPDHDKHRTAVRQTWGHFALRRDVLMLFMVGRTSKPDVQSIIDKENERFGDVVQSNSVDHYGNLTLKTAAMFEWVKTYCSEVPFILKTDDDMFINMPLLLAFIDSKRNDKRVLYGRLAKGWKPVRSKRSKYYVDLSTYSKITYPDFVTGPAYLFTNDIVEEMYQKILSTDFFFLEDVLITGIIGEYLNIRRVGDSRFRNEKIKISDTCKLMQTISIHMVKYEEQFDIYKRTLDGKTKCRTK